MIRKKKYHSSQKHQTIWLAPRLPRSVLQTKSTYPEYGLKTENRTSLVISAGSSKSDKVTGVTGVTGAMGGSEGVSPGVSCEKVRGTTEGAAL